MLPPHRPSEWRKSSYSDSGNGCVEVALAHSGGVAIRDDKIPGSPMILFSLDQWSRWLDEVIKDELTDNNGAVNVAVRDGVWTVNDRSTGVTLEFNETEWAAFRLGAINGEFSKPADFALS